MLGEVLIRFKVAELKNGRTRLAPHRAHLIGKAVGLHEVGGLCGTVRDKRTTTVLTHDEAHTLKLLQGEANRRTGKSVALGELTFGGNHVARTVLMLDLIGEDVDKLIV